MQNETLVGAPLFLGAKVGMHGVYRSLSWPFFVKWPTAHELYSVCGLQKEWWSKVGM